MLNKERLNNLSDKIWKGAIALRGKFKAKDYPSVILPMIMIRRIEAVLEEKRQEFREDLLAKTPDLDEKTLNTRIKIKEKNLIFYNTSNWTLKGILAEASSQVDENLREYLEGFSPNIKDIIDKFDYNRVITQVAKAKRLYSVIRLFSEEENLKPSRLSNLEMGYVYEELLQRFS